MESILITKRDRMLMKWVNSVGFATVEHIAEKMDMSKWAAYKRVKKLVLKEYLNHQRFYYGLPGVYSVTEKGVEYANSHLPPIKMISKGSYDHDIAVTKMIIALSKRFNTDITTERELRYQKAQDGIGQYGHIADAEMILENKKIAIEVELTKKGNKRLKTIITDYMKNFDVNEVWYFCGNQQIKRQIAEYQSVCSFLKIFDLDEMP